MPENNENLGTVRFQKKLDHRASKMNALRVLAVDDEPSILELLQTALAAFDNFTVSVANSGSSALKLIKSSEKPFDCLLLDIQMPKMNGIELLREVREISDYAEVPVIMLTAMSDRKYVDQAFLEGATDYVAKPFDFFELRSRMNVAHKLMQERIKAKKSLESAKFLREELEYNQQFSFDDPFSIEGVDRLLRYVEFDNYVAQLSRGRLFESSTVAAKLQDAEFYFDLTNCSDFRRAVTDIARTIEKTTKDIDAVFSYRGSGTFLILTHGRTQTAEMPSEERINQVFGTLLGNRRASGWTRVLLGDQISMRSLSKTGATAALNKAVQNVEQREQTIRKDVDALPLADEDFASEEQGQLRRKVYERVLMELFGEEKYLAQK